MSEDPRDTEGKRFLCELLRPRDFDPLVASLVPTSEPSEEDLLHGSRGVGEPLAVTREMIRSPPEHPGLLKEPWNPLARIERRLGYSPVTDRSTAHLPISRFSATDLTHECFDALCQMMNLASIVVLSEVSGVPRVKMDLPPNLRLGDKLALRFRVKRVNGGRSEILDVNGEFRIASMTYEAGSHRQILGVEGASGLVPSWRAIKRAPEFRRVIPPARSPRTVVA